MNKTDLNMTWHGRFFSPFRIIIINEILRKICESATCTDNSGAATPLVMKSSGICSKIIYIYYCFDPTHSGKKWFLFFDIKCNFCLI